MAKVITTESTQAEILAIAEEEDKEFKARRETELTAHKERQKKLKRMSDVAPVEKAK